jgi:hypothetical protein
VVDRDGLESLLGASIELQKITSYYQKVCSPVVNGSDVVSGCV